MRPESWNGYGRCGRSPLAISNPLRTARPRQLCGREVFRRKSAAHSTGAMGMAGPTGRLPSRMDWSTIANGEPTGGVRRSNMSHRN
jgi:hypothetical protein